jgi:arginase family enzyme
MIRTINGGKSNFHIRARSIKPSCYKKMSRNIMSYLSMQSINNKYMIKKTVEHIRNKYLPQYEL